MNAIIQAALALLAAGGLVLIGWLLLGRLLAPVGASPGAGMCVVVPARGGGAALEHTVAGLLWLRGGGFVRFPIVLADCGLDDAGLETARLLVQRGPGVTLCPLAELEVYIKDTTEDGRS